MGENVASSSGGGGSGQFTYDCVIPRDERAHMWAGDMDCHVQGIDGQAQSLQTDRWWRRPVGNVTHELRETPTMAVNQKGNRDR